MGIRNDKIYSILSVASEETRANEMNVESWIELDILSPATWNPHSDAYSTNEESMLDWEGNMQPKRDRQHQIILDNMEDDVNMVASLQITQLEQEVIDAHLTEFRQPLQVQSHLEMPGILVQLGHIQRT